MTTTALPPDHPRHTLPSMADTSSSGPTRPVGRWRVPRGGVEFIPKGPLIGGRLVQAAGPARSPSRTRPRARSSLIWPTPRPRTAWPPSSPPSPPRPAGPPARRERSRIPRPAAEGLRQEIEALALTLTREMGKPLAESGAEVAFAADYLDWSADQALHIEGRTITSPDGQSRHLVVKGPVGPCLVITP